MNTKISLKSWLPTVSVSLASFIFVTSEFIPVGLLPEISRGLGKSEATIGLLMTIYAWIVATMSLPMTVISSHWDRRRLMLILLGAFVFANLASGLATSFNFLLICRLVVAFAHAVFWSIAIPLAIRLAPPGGHAKALSIIAMGASLGNILGIPFGTFLGQSFGWRMAFTVIAFVAFVIFLILYRTLPLLPSQSVTTFKRVPSLFKRKTLVLVYLMTALTVTGHFTAFTYIKPFLQSIGGLSPDFVVILLFVFGASGVFGSVLGSKIIYKRPMSSLVFSLVIVLASLLLMALAVHSQLWLVLLSFIWGTALTIICLVFQSAVLSEAPDVQDVAMSLYSGIFNIGIGSGALLGSLSSSNHLGSVGYLGSAFVLVSLLITFRLHIADLKATTGATH
ncbi:MAG: sugar transporter [Bdellovibrio sp.]|nr:sugar transporter [Bdellovibrio sp.]